MNRENSPNGEARTAPVDEDCAAARAAIRREDVRRIKRRVVDPPRGTTEAGEAESHRLPLLLTLRVLLLRERGLQITDESLRPRGRGVRADELEIAITPGNDALTVGGSTQAGEWVNADGRLNAARLAVRSESSICSARYIACATAGVSHGLSRSAPLRTRAHDMNSESSTTAGSTWRRA